MKGKTKPYKMKIPLPENTIVQHGIMIVSYFEDDGSTNFGLNLTGEANLSAILGVMELAKAQILKNSDDWGT